MPSIQMKSMGRRQKHRDLIPAHDWDLFKTLKKTPQFYE